MSSVLFLCEGVPAPAEWRGQWPTTDRLDTEGARSSVNFAIRNPEKVFLGSLDGRALDLIRIGAFALAVHSGKHEVEEEVKGHAVTIRDARSSDTRRDGRGELGVEVLRRREEDRGDV